MFFSLRDLIVHYPDALTRKINASRTHQHHRVLDVSVCLDRFFSQKNSIIALSLSRGILTLRAAHASARFAVETKKEKLLLCFKKHNIPVKKIICKI